MQSTDGLIVYTDGIPEARNINGEFYGLERLCEVISSHWHLDVEQIKQSAIDDLRQFIGEQKVFDDITLVILKRTTGSNDEIIYIQTQEIFNSSNADTDGIENQCCDCFNYYS